MSTQKRGTRVRALYLVLLAVSFILFLSETAFAQTPPPYVPLVGLPQLAGGGQGLGAYFNQLYMAIVAVGAIIAFIKIAFAGVQYSMSDIVTSKEKAKDDIKGALLGLTILLVPFVVLNTIYPNLTNLNILNNANNVRYNTNVPPAGSGAQGSTSLIPPQMRSGYTTANCNFTQVQNGVDQEQAPQYVFDSTSCEQWCASLNGSVVSRTQYNLNCQYRFQ